LNQVADISASIVSFNSYLITTNSHLMRNWFWFNYFSSTGKNMFKRWIVFIIVSDVFACNRISSSEFKSCNLGLVEWLSELYVFLHGFL
jgi:hypothetical protein